MSEIYKFTTEQLQEYTDICKQIGVSAHRSTDNVVIELLTYMESEYPGIKF